MDFGKLDNSEFLWRRLLDDMPAWAVAVPVVFALAVLLLVTLFRRENRWSRSLLGLGVIGVLAAVYVPLALLFRPMFSWLVVLVPLFVLALVYVGLMYRRDARTIHPAIAAFLGLLRCAVYTILALVFLLPGCQTYDENVSYPKVLFLFDVSGSMNTVDDLPEAGQDPATLPTRQDKVIQFLTATRDAQGREQVPFADRVAKNVELAAYRFGPTLDETQVVTLKDGRSFALAEWNGWLKPNKADVKVPDDVPEEQRPAQLAKLHDLIDSLVSGTNVGGAALQAAKLENNSFLQAIVIVSDGQSNVGSDEALKEFLTRVNNPKRTVPVFTVGVGAYRQPASIRIDDLLAPEVVRPDDKFPIRVPVVGTGLTDQEFEVTLEAAKVDDRGQPLKGEKTYFLGPKQGKFTGAGDNPQDTVEFEIDVQELKGLKAASDKAGDLEGTWQFTARVPRNPREAFPKPVHVSDPVKVQVQKKELRVLLFAGAATREYQFVRTLFFREELEKRVRLSIFLQSAAQEDHVDQDVDKERMLRYFPNRRGEAKAGEKYYSLSEYDVIIAFDPDWTALTPEQLKLVKEWVDKDSGGVIFVAGPVHTFHLARPGALDLSALTSIFPVNLKDSRLHGLDLPGAGLGHDTTRPYVLHFMPAAKQYDFLKLDEEGDSPTAGWDAFFWGSAKAPAAEPGKDVRPRRGFFNYYPVDKLKPDSAVLATFAGPPNTRINDGKDEQPFVVAMRYGGGKTLYLGSGELWRLRQYKEGFHERFWIKLARYAGGGSSLQKKYGSMYLPRVASTGSLSFEARLRDGRDDLPRDAHPTVYVRKLGGEKEQPPAKFDMKPRPVDDPKDWRGIFTTSVKLPEEGKYELKVPIPGTDESLRQELTVRKPNPELDNVRNNFDYLYQLASEAPPVLARLGPEARRDVERVLKAPVSQQDLEKSEGREVPRLFFTLNTADAISKFLGSVPPRRESIKGPLFDLWDKGVESGWAVSGYHLAWGLPLVVGLLGGALLLFMRQFTVAAFFVGGCALLALIAALLGLVPGLDWPLLPLDFSFILVAIVTLLGVEWLTRKLLKLA